MQQISLQELDKIEQMIAGKRKRQSLRLLERFPEPEKVIVCMYEPIKTGSYIMHEDIKFFILTNFRALYSEFGTDRSMEIMLKPYSRAELTKDIWGALFLGVTPPSTHLFVFEKKDKELAEHLTSEMNKAISHAKIQVSTATFNINTTAPQDDRIVDQLRKLADLHAQGILTDEEFARAKQRVIG